MDVMPSGVLGGRIGLTQEGESSFPQDATAVHQEAVLGLILQDIRRLQEALRTHVSQVPYKVQTKSKTYVIEHGKVICTAFLGHLTLEVVNMGAEVRVTAGQHCVKPRVPVKVAALYLANVSNSPHSSRCHSARTGMLTSCTTRNWLGWNADISSTSFCERIKTVCHGLPCRFEGSSSRRSATVLIIWMSPVWYLCSVSTPF